jgi:hypothetical protein
VRTRGLRRDREGRGGGERRVEDAAERRHEVRRDGLAGRQAIVDKSLVLQLLPLRRRERVTPRGNLAAGVVAHHHHLCAIASSASEEPLPDRFLAC